MEIRIPEKAVIVMVGASQSGKTTFINRHFADAEVLSASGEPVYVCNSDFVVSDSENISKAERKKLIAMAKNCNLQSIAIVLNLPEEVLLRRNRDKSWPKVTNREIVSKSSSVASVRNYLKSEGFDLVFEFFSEEEIENLTVIREKLPCNKAHLSGPFDIIGDVHGCHNELEKLLKKLGYQPDENGVYRHPEGRLAVFVGDMCDKGTHNGEVLLTIADMVANGSALAVKGNHDDKLARYLNGSEIELNAGINRTIGEINRLSEEERNRIRDFLLTLPCHLILDEGRLLVVHAAIKPAMIGKDSRAVREFCMYGEIDREFNEFNVPTRLFSWAEEYDGDTLIVYGHTPNYTPRWINRTLCLDTGCVLGNRLTALRYPEMKFSYVKSRKNYL
ncbi:MAG: metallophosphoesterase [Erysipelotrichaceae bacterium]|nr:metallophosphoesterase [Erysipelotrichaceae bacterium]